MDQIVKHYTEAVLSLIGLSFLFIILFQSPFLQNQKGQLAYIGIMSDQSEKKDMQKEAFLVFQKEGEKKLPYMKYDVNMPEIRVGEESKLRAYFSAYNYADEAVPYTFLKLYDFNHEIADGIYNEESDSLLFSKSGVYEADFKTKDSTNRIRIYHFRFPVER